MNRRRKSAAEPPGQDSFLDVVANLVGILIILVVVIGAHAGASWTDREKEAKQKGELASLAEEAERAQHEAGNRERHNLEIEERIRQEAAMAALRESERDAMLIRIRQSETKIDQIAQDASSAQREVLDLTQQVEQANAQLISLQRETDAVLARESGPNIIEHLPTPIARTVFSNEVHYRLQNGRLCFVPLNELVDEMRNEWRVKADNLKAARETVETVGPLEGFRMQYKLALTEQVFPGQFGDIVREVPEFVGFVLIPVGNQLGTSIDEALAGGSWFDRQISRLQPGDTTVTIWVYPDSYDEFSQVKQWLFERGFLTAGWPLPDGYPIAGGPNGYRSSAQ